MTHITNWGATAYRGSYYPVKCHGRRLCDAIAIGVNECVRIMTSGFIYTTPVYKNNLRWALEAEGVAVEFKVFEVRADTGFQCQLLCIERM